MSIAVNAIELLVRIAALSIGLGAAVALLFGKKPKRVVALSALFVILMALDAMLGAGWENVGGIAASSASSLVFMLVGSRLTRTLPARVVLASSVLLISMGTSCSCLLGSFGVKALAIQVGAQTLGLFALWLYKSGLVRRLVALWMPGLYVLALTLLALPLTPLGLCLNGASNWICLPAGLTAQPSEAAKILLILVCAMYATTKASLLEIKSRAALFPAVFAAAAVGILLVVEKDVGTLGVLLAALASIVLGSSRRSAPIYLVSMVVLAAFFVMGCCFASEHISTRMKIFLNPEAMDPTGPVAQWFAARAVFASSGLLGCGSADLSLKVPVVESDFVSCVLAEAYGALGIVVLASCYMAIALRTFFAARSQDTSFDRGCASGMCMLIVFTAIVNLATASNSIPGTGVCLPLVSAGGSSAMSTLVALGLCAAALDCNEGEEGPCVASQPKRATVALLACLAAVALVTVRMALLCLGAGVFGDGGRETRAGNISTADGIVVARSENGSRDYPEGDLASHLVGSIDGAPGFEAVGEYRVRVDGGLDDSAISQALRLPKQGEDLTLAIDSVVQRSAQQELDGRTGAIVLIDGASGRILALASSGAPVLGSAIAGDYFNRATAGAYSPGSTFKLVALAAAVDSGWTAGDLLPGGSPYKTVKNVRGLSIDEVTLQDATSKSLNTAFARIAEEVGVSKMASVASSLFPAQMSEVPVARAVVSFEKMDPEEFCWAACGQAVGDNGPLVSPAALASAMQIVCNKGEYVSPLFVEGDEQLKESRLSAKTAEDVVSILKSNGQAFKEGFVFGKTGTSENASGSDDSWFVGCLETSDGDRRIVGAMVAEKSGSGSSLAKPALSRVLRVAASR